MVNLENYLYEKVKPIIEGWNEKDIYAISFFVYSNEAYSYQDYNNISEFSIGYNTEEDCNHASALSEARWNFAYWRQDMTHIINPFETDDGTKVLFQWYKENGIENIGFESDNEQYDSDYNYIGKGPIGYLELLSVVSNVAKRLQLEGFVSERFGDIPIIVHELEYTWYVEKATESANPNGEAATFLKALRERFPE